MHAHVTRAPQFVLVYKVEVEESTGRDQRQKRKKYQWRRRKFLYELRPEAEASTRDFWTLTHREEEYSTASQWFLTSYF